MMRFMVDEDMPRSTAKALRNAGFECLDIRDIGLRGARDKAIYQRAQDEDCILITEDLGFSNTLRYPLGSHRGIIIIRLPNEVPTSELNEILINAVKNILKDLPGNVIIIEADRIRIRRK